MKTTVGYAEMSAADQTAFDAKIKARNEKKNAQDAKLKNQSEYHLMTDDEKTMYDKMILA